MQNKWKEQKKKKGEIKRENNHLVSILLKNTLDDVKINKYAMNVR